jgi:RHS repeat-associated protein
VTVGSSGTSNPITDSVTPPQQEWGRFGYGYKQGNGSKLGREVQRASPTAQGPGLFHGQGWAFEEDNAFRMLTAVAGQGSLVGAASAPGGTETFGYAYGPGDELVATTRKGEAESTSCTSGVEGRLEGWNGQTFAYDAEGRRVEDDRFTYLWNWRSELVGATVKDEWPPQKPGGSPVVSPWAGHKLLFERDATGRLMARELRGVPATAGDEASRPFVSRSEYVWDGDTLLAETGLAYDGAVLWRKSFVPGTSINDHVQLRLEVYGQGATPDERLFTYLRDEQRTVLGLVHERVDADPQKPPVVLRYLYTPLGEVHAETGPELRRARFDASVSTTAVPGGATVSQTLASAGEAGGALLVDFSIGIDPATLGGVGVERRLSDGTWGALAEAERAIGWGEENAGQLVVLPLAGWTRGTTYRVSLTSALKDGIGRVVSSAPVLEIPIPGDATGGGPPAFETAFPFGYETYQAAGDSAGGLIPGGNPYLFHGMYFDAVLGLALTPNRVYDPRTGHWLTIDPLDDVDSPNLYAFVGWRPHMATDASGLEREEVPIDPKSKGAKKAERIKERYNKAYEDFVKSSPKAAAAAKKLEESKTYKLRVQYDPKPIDPTEAAHVGDYKFDKDGNVVEATLHVGPEFGSGNSPPKDTYPKGATINNSREKKLYTVAHEEQGHFMQTVNDTTKNPQYLQTLQKKEEMDRAREAAASEAKMKGGDYLAEYKKLRQERGIDESPETMLKRSKALEESADDVGMSYVEESRKR